MISFGIAVSYRWVVQRWRSYYRFCCIQWWKRTLPVFCWEVSCLPIPTLSKRWSLFYIRSRHIWDKLATWFWCWSREQYFHTIMLQSPVGYSSGRWFQERRYSWVCFRRWLSCWLSRHLVQGGMFHPSHGQDSYFFLYKGYSRTLHPNQCDFYLEDQIWRMLQVSSCYKQFGEDGGNLWYHWLLNEVWKQCCQNIEEVSHIADCSFQRWFRLGRPYNQRFPPYR